jgi:formylglycine-generating enzyme required for sulfatase activity
MAVNTPSEPDTFDKETAEKWLLIDKKKRKTIAKIKHPAQAIADEAAAAAKKLAAGKQKQQDPTTKEYAAAARSETKANASANDDEVAKSE